MEGKLQLFLGIGTVLMAVPIIIAAKQYGISLWKSIVTSVALTCVGTIGTILMFFLENGYISGISFYGAVFFVPIAFCLFAKMLRVPYTQLTDLCALGECVMLAIMKVNCTIGGCCSGRTFLIVATGRVVVFPSQIVELLVALLIFVLLMHWFYKYPSRRGQLYAWYLVLYGVTRFLLNFMRAEWQHPTRIPMGTVWSLVAVLIGALWLLKAYRISKGKSCE